MELAVSSEFECFQVSVRREEGKITPKDVDDRARVDCARGGVSEREMREDGW